MDTAAQLCSSLRQVCLWSRSRHSRDIQRRKSGLNTASHTWFAETWRQQRPRHMSAPRGEVESLRLPSPPGSQRCIRPCQPYLETISKPRCGLSSRAQRSNLSCQGLRLLRRRVAPNEVIRAASVMLSEAKHLGGDRKLSIAANGISHSMARSFAGAQDDKGCSRALYSRHQPRSGSATGNDIHRLEPAS